METCACGKSLPTKPFQSTNVHEQVEKEAWRKVWQDPVWRATDCGAEKTKGDARNVWPLVLNCGPFCRVAYNF